MHEHSGPMVKAKNSKLAWREFFRSIKKYRVAIYSSILFCVGSAVLGLFTPKLLGEMTTIAVESYPDINWGALTEKAIIIIILFCLSAILSYAQAYILAIVSAKYTRDLREKIIDKISRLPIAYFDKHKFGDTLSRMTNDVDVLTTSMSQEIADISLSLTTLVGVMIIMLTISVPLSLITFIVVPISVFVVGKIMKFAQKYFREQQNTLGALNSKIEETYAGQIIVKSNSYEGQALSDFRKTNEKLTRSARRAQIFSSLSFPVTHIFTNLGYVAICILGGFFAIEGRISTSRVLIGRLRRLLRLRPRFSLCSQRAKESLIS